MRTDNRKADELRPVSFVPDFQYNPSGSVLVAVGRTRVICSASVVEGVPRWMTNEGAAGGWLTAEYQMLPGATGDRVPREVSRGRISGRSAEIQRLIGRSLRAVVDLEKIPGKTIYVDCDVLDADGGTRCAAITGASVAVELALRKMFRGGALSDWPMRARVAAVSVGVVGGEILLDLCYAEDSAAEVDMNLVMTSAGAFIEIQGTAEGAPFDETQLQAMLASGKKAIAELCALQKKTVADCG